MPCIRPQALEIRPVSGALVGAVLGVSDAEQSSPQGDFSTCSPSQEHEIIKELHKKVDEGDIFVPEEGQRTTLCSNESPFRCPSSGITSSVPVPVVSIEEYRKMLGDYVSTDKQIFDRLWYLEGLCRTIIREELKAYDNEPN